MSELSQASFSESPPPGHPHDLLARLYREIGISAVAAALEAIAEDDAPATLVAQIDEAIPVGLRETRAA